LHLVLIFLLDFFLKQDVGVGRVEAFVVIV